MILLSFLLLLQSSDAETYDTLLRCAAFHGIESERLARDEGAAAGDAQKAIAEDFVSTARALLSDDNEANALETDLRQRKADYLDRLASGELRATAEQWTALELACKELHPMLRAIRSSGEGR